MSNHATQYLLNILFGIQFLFVPITCLSIVDVKLMSSRKFLYYSKNFNDYCAGIGHFRWSITCALGEAAILGRTFVLHDDYCVHFVHNDGISAVNPISMYFDVEHMKRYASVVEYSTFQKLNSSEADFVKIPLSTSTAYLQNLNNTILHRVFENNEYFYNVCDNNLEVQRLWNAISFAPQLLDIAWKICDELKWDFDAVHIRRGDKAARKEFWPHLDEDTKPPKLLVSLKKHVESHRILYIATNEKNISMFDPLNEHFIVKYLTDFSFLWEEYSEWWNVSEKLAGKKPKLDGLMKGIVDYTVMNMAKKLLETFNDLTNDSKHGIDSKIN